MFQHHLNLEQDTLHVTVALIDDFLECQSLSLNNLQLLGITALLVASKFEERFAPHVSRLAPHVSSCAPHVSHLSFRTTRESFVILHHT